MESRDIPTQSLAEIEGRNRKISDEEIFGAVLVQRSWLDRSSLSSIDRRRDDFLGRDLGSIDRPLGRSIDIVQSQKNSCLWTYFLEISLPTPFTTPIKASGVLEYTCGTHNTKRRERDWLRGWEEALEASSLLG